MSRELFRHLFKKPTTLTYPFKKKPSVKDMRGRPVWDMSLCIGCGLCNRVCPSGAIEMVGKGSEAEIIHHVGRCMFCAQCVEDCPVNAILMTEEYELASDDRTEMTIEYKRPKPPQTKD